MKSDFRFLALVVTASLAAGSTALAQEESQANRVTQAIGQLQPRGGQDVTDPTQSQQALPNLQPEWVPLPQDHREYIDKLLEHWESKSSQIKQCTTDFRRWDYDTRFCDKRNPDDGSLSAYVVWDGKIRYAEPDKAHYETNQMWTFSIDDSQINYKPSEDKSQKQKWVCDGKNIYEFDYANKILHDVGIPEEFQGDGLVNSPLPFLFGAKKDIVNSRYWLRVITPPNVDTEYWLEAHPKRIEDARIYKKIEVVIDMQDFMPKSLHVYSANYDPSQNQLASSFFLFSNRHINDNRDKVKDFFGYFVRPVKPIGWTRSQPAPVNGPASSSARNPQPNQPIK